MWPCRVALSLPQRHPATCGLAPTISMSRQVTVSRQVTARHSWHGNSRCHGLSEQSRAEPPYPHLGRAGVDTAFPGDSKCLHSWSQQHPLDERVGDVGRMAEDGRPLVFGHQDFAKVHEMPLRGGSRGTAGASPDANGRLDNRIPRDSRSQILPDTGKTGTDGENLSYNPSIERQDCYHVGNERGSVSEQRRLADSRPPAHP